MSSEEPSEELSKEHETHLDHTATPVALNIATPSMQRVIATSVISGFCLLVPIPFLDDYLLSKLMRTMTRAQLRAYGVDASKDAIKKLVKDPSGKGFLGYVFGAGAYVAKKIFRKLVYVLAIKDGIDIASRVFHKGWLVEVALMRGWLTDEILADDAWIETFQNAVQATCNSVDPRPLNQALKRIFTDRNRGAHRASKAFAESLRSVAKKSDQDIDRALSGGDLKELTQDVGDALTGEEGYLRDVARTFEVFLRAAQFPGV